MQNPYSGHPSAGFQGGIVENESVQVGRMGMFEQIADIVNSSHLVYFAAAVQAAALLFTEQVKIRVLLLIGSALYLVYYAVVAGDPLWEAMAATLAMSIANLFGLTALMVSRSARFIPANQMNLYSMFSGVEPGEFRALMKRGTLRTLIESETLTTVGAVPDRLFFVIEGEIEVEQGQGCFQLPPRHFLGEISLMLGTPASATVRVGAGAHLVEWQREKLVRAMTRQPKLKIAVESLLGRDMARKVAVLAGHIDSNYVHGDPAMDTFFKP